MSGRRRGTSLAEAFAKFFYAAKAADPRAVEDALDIWSDAGGDGPRHKYPNDRQLPTGPTEEASGYGASEMTDQYSDPDPNADISTRQASRLGRRLNSRGTPVPVAIAQGKSFAAKAYQAAKEMRAQILTASLAQIDGDANAMATAIQEAQALKAKAHALLLKAKEDLEDEDGEDDDESVDCATKSLLTATRKLEALAKGAGMPAAASQGSGTDFGMPNLTVPEALRVIGGGAIGKAVPQMSSIDAALAKAYASAPAQPLEASISERIEEMRDAHQLDDLAYNKALWLLNSYKQMKVGHISATDFFNHAGTASDKIREVFGLRTEYKPSISLI